MDDTPETRARGAERVTRPPRGRVASTSTPQVVGRGASVATSGRVPETFPVDHYQRGGAFMDYRMGYRDAVTGVLYASRYGQELAVPSEAMPPLRRRK